MSFVATLIWVLLLAFTLWGSSFLLGLVSKTRNLSRDHWLGKTVSTSIALTLLILLSPFIGHTNAMDAALVRSGQINYAGEAVALGWFEFPNALNYILAMAMRAGATPLLMSFLIAVLGLILWFFAYLLAAKSFGYSHITSLTVAFGLTYWNPFLIFFSQTFGFQPPWSGNSTYGMLGSALVAFGMSLALSGRYKSAFVFSIIAILVSPVNGATLAFVVFMLGVRAIRHRDWPLSMIFFLWLLVGVTVSTWSGLQVSAYRGELGLINSEAFNTYLIDWDSHRHPYRYNLHFSLVALVLLTSFAGVALSRSRILDQVVVRLAARRRFSLLSISLSLLLPLIYWALITFLGQRDAATTQAQVLLIQEMPLRLTTNTGFVVIILIFGAVAIIGRGAVLQEMGSRIFSTSPGRKALVTLTFLAGLGFIIGSYFLGNLQSRETWFTFLTDNKRGPSALTMKLTPDELGRQVRQRGTDGIGLTMAAPGLSYQLMWQAQLPILLHTENGIDFVGYLPELADEVGTLLTEGYGLDFTNNQNPPRCGCIPHDPKIRMAWESRTTEEWREFSTRFDVSYVATPSDWDLRLRQVADVDGVTVFEIR